jgi:hypothetical protein
MLSHRLSITNFYDLFPVGFGKMKVHFYSLYKHGSYLCFKQLFMRVQFRQLFTILDNGMMRPTTTIQINGQILSPGASFGNGAVIGGVNFFDHIGQDVEVEQLPNDIYEIKGFYQ